jgi:hypothetical protein
MALSADVSEDLSNLMATVSGLTATVGRNEENQFPDIWSGLNDIASNVKNDEFQKMHEAVTHAVGKIRIQDADINTNNVRWTSLLKNWIPVIADNAKRVKRLKLAVESFATASVVQMPLTHDDVNVILNKQHDDSQFQSTRLNPTQEIEETFKERFSTTNSKVADMERRLLAIEGHDIHRSDASWHEFERCLDSNQSARLGIKGVSYKNFFFQNEKKLEDWMRKHMTHPSHGLFVDLVSFSEFFGGQRYVERNMTLNDLYLTNKIGYGCMADSIVAASFQNVLPGAYGRRPDSSHGAGRVSSSDLDSQEELPGLSTFSKWDNQDGSTGRKYWIKREARNTAKQVDNMIRSQLTGPPQLLAKELLMDSLSMSQALFSFISTSYDDTVYAARFDSDQAWAMTCKFVKRIFTELADVRVIARDGIHTEDQWATAAKFLFTTLKAHEIMEEYMRLNIKDHPSISSEMVKFVCYSQPATDTAEVLSRLCNLESLQRGDQSGISRLEARIKKLEVWKTETDKTIKKLVDKHGI